MIVRVGTMTQKKEGKTRKSLTSEGIERMIKEWDDKTTSEWAKEFSVSYQTILHMVKEVRKVDDNLCPPKPKTGRTRAAIAKKGIALFWKK